MILKLQQFSSNFSLPPSSIMDDFSSKYHGDSKEVLTCNDCRCFLIKAHTFVETP